VPSSARLLARDSARGESPSASGFDATLKAPLPSHLYVRARTQASANTADVDVGGTLLCKDAERGVVESKIPPTTGKEEVVVEVKPPKGAQRGTECTPLVVSDASTDPGSMMLLTIELLGS
jgi:hypothetical protein